MLAGWKGNDTTIVVKLIAYQYYGFNIILDYCTMIGLWKKAWFTKLKNVLSNIIVNNFFVSNSLKWVINHQSATYNV